MPEGSTVPEEGPPTEPPASSRPPALSPRRRKPKSVRFLLLSLGALGIIYGDIGTSPLYAIRESFVGTFGVQSSPANILGVLSLVTWSLILIVAIKYQLIVLRADNEGEGGILALTALVGLQDVSDSLPAPKRTRSRKILIAIGIFGAALLFGDGILTPAISVLSAVEGLEVLEPSFGEFVVPLTVAILAGLFLLQRRGTGGVGSLFGPVTLVWFLVLAALGVRGILMAPQVLAALNPVHALYFFSDNGLAGFLVLGAVFLVVTGSEALYADLGHFGPGPIRFSWFTLVGPGLLLNYFGQGALILSDPSTASSPFYLLAPRWGLVPLIVLSTAATIIASQAIISGMFSLGMQAVQLGYWPRLDVRHTSERQYGQIYIPPVNWALFIGTVLLVVAFGSSGALAAAYGVAIVCTMIVTTILLYVILPERLGWYRWLAWLIISVFLVVELTFLGANVVKIHEGGWVPLAIAAVLFTMMTTWNRGRQSLGQKIAEHQVPLRRFVESLPAQSAFRVPGNAIYMTGNADATPSPLLTLFKHQRVLHERIIILTVRSVRAPHVRAENRVQIDPLGARFYRVVARYGFMETPNALEILEFLRLRGLDLPLKDTTFVLGRERVLPAGLLLARWRTGVFSFLARNSQRATAFFNIPPDRVVEVGSQIEV